MKCEDCLDVIEEYFDKELGALSSIDVAAHLVACTTCAQAYEALKQEQMVYASYKREVEVTPALWQGIQARIREEALQPVVAEEAAVESVGLLQRLRNFVATLHAPRFSPALAAALVIVAVGATVVVMNYLNSRSGNQPTTVATANKSGEPSPGPGNQNADAGANSQSGTPVVSGGPEETPKEAMVSPKKENRVMPVKATAEKVNPVPPSERQQPLVNSSQIAQKLVRDAEQKYLAAITLLKRDYDKRRTQLDPQFVAKMDAALTTIDNTIAETRKAVQQNPDDPIALQYMLAAYAKKVEVLKGVAGS